VRKIFFSEKVYGQFWLAVSPFVFLSIPGQFLREAKEEIIHVDISESYKTKCQDIIE
jgi:hypothetical protein